jgi:hypothetical protein
MNVSAIQYYSGNSEKLKRFNEPVVYYNSHAEVCTHVRSKLVSVHIWKVHRGRNCTTPLILNRCTKWMLVVSFTPQPIYHGKKRRYRRNLGWVCSRSSENKNLLPMLGFELWIRCTIPITDTLSRQPPHARTHARTRIYVYMFVCVCVCVRILVDYIYN